MSAPSLRFTMVAAVLALSGMTAMARLPAPGPEAQAKAAEAAARTAWSGKVDAYKLCQVQDRVVARYRAGAAMAGKPAAPALPTAACTDPGPFAYAPPAAKAEEGAAAHSPAATAAAPPSGQAQPAAPTGAPAKAP